MATTTRSITIPADLDPITVLGPADSVLREVERGYPDLTIIARGNKVAVLSRSASTEPQAVEAEQFVRDLIESAYSAPLDADAVRRLLDRRLRHKDTSPLTVARPGKSGAQRRREADQRRIQRTLDERAASGDPAYAAHPAADGLSLTGRPRLPEVIAFALGAPVRPKTEGQIEYCNRIDHNIVTFGIGPAGTGKTYLAVAKAVRAFEDGRVRRIILTRPAVEAGESLGFLPGTLTEKIDPYLRPLYDALSDMLGQDQLHRYMNDGTIEVAPLAYMRGRTLNDAFVILDEAQNTTEQQMKMFLTRLGFNTKMVVTGDITQVDLDVRHSGLKTIERVLSGIDQIAFVHLRPTDVVRHALVGRIVQAYERYDEERERRADRKEGDRTDKHGRKDA